MDAEEVVNELQTFVGAFKEIVKKYKQEQKWQKILLEHYRNLVPFRKKLSQAPEIRRLLENALMIIDRKLRDVEKGLLINLSAEEKEDIDFFCNQILTVKLWAGKPFA